MVVEYIKELHNMYVFTSPSTQAGCDKSSIFKQSLKSFNSEISF